jgi:hypothetical protein
MLSFRSFIETITAQDLDFAQRHRIQIASDGKFILYHGTRTPAAMKIRQEGFKPGTFFTEDIQEAMTAQDGPMGTQGSRRGKMVVLKVKIDPNLLWLGVRIQAKERIPCEEIA